MLEKTLHEQLDEAQSPDSERAKAIMNKFENRMSEKLDKIKGKRNRIMMEVLSEDKVYK